MFAPLEKINTYDLRESAKISVWARFVRLGVSPETRPDVEDLVLEFLDQDFILHLGTLTSLLSQSPWANQDEAGSIVSRPHQLSPGMVFHHIFCKFIVV